MKKLLPLRERCARTAAKVDRLKKELEAARDLEIELGRTYNNLLYKEFDKAVHKEGFCWCTATERYEVFDPATGPKLILRVYCYTRMIDVGQITTIMQEQHCTDYSIELLPGLREEDLALLRGKRSFTSYFPARDREDGQTEYQDRNGDWFWTGRFNGYHTSAQDMRKHDFDEETAKKLGFPEPFDYRLYNRLGVQYGSTD